jgi:glyoxylase-like metal-dependent hydrolase (beta-lactamase superfamily II)
VSLVVDQILVGRFSVCCYLVSDLETKEAVLIDPGADADRILEAVAKRQARIRWMVCTHSHPDHVGANASVRNATGSSLALHSQEAAAVRSFKNRLFTRLMGGRPSPKADRCLEDGDILYFGESRLSVLHTPGHSPGSICLLAEGHLFSGDTLFVGGVGRVDLPGSSWRELGRSLREKVLLLPDDTVLWPGHHYGETPTSTVGKEKLLNPFLREIRRAGGPSIRR